MNATVYIILKVFLFLNFVEEILIKFLQVNEYSERLHLY